jgi:predicted acyltransferase
MTFVPVPGIGSGILLPGKNLANYIDLKFLPGSLCRGTWDNEGLFSTLPAIASVLLGIFAGHWLRSSRTPDRKTAGLLVSGFCCLVLGKIWNIWFPINKLMWTSSYVLYAGGWSLLLLSLFYWVIDVKRYRKWAFPFVVIGMNAIVLYALGAFIGFDVLTNRLIGGEVANLFGPAKMVWLYTGEMILRWLLLYWLYHKKIFIKF